MNKTILLFFSIIVTLSIHAQNVGIGTSNPDASAKLDIDASNAGILIPRVNLLGATDAVTVPSPATGLMLWNTGASFGTAGFYYNTGTPLSPNWIRILDSSSSIADADSNPSNEIQDLSISGNTLSLSGDATTVDLSGYTNTDNQDLSLSGNTLSLTNDASTVNLAGYLDNTDDQKIDVFSFSGSILSLSLESDAEATKTIDLAPLKDHDWYESAGTNQADDIDDNIYTQGNVGIGLTTPLERLHVKGTGTIAKVLITPDITSSGEDTELILGEDADATYGMKLTFDGGDNKLYFRGFNSGYATNNDPHMTIERDNGEVGINTTTPDAILDVEGDFRITGVNSKVEFNTKESINGWTLIYRDDFETSNDGWQMYENVTSSTVDNTFDRESFGVIALSTNLNNYDKGNDEDNVFKKLYDMSGISWTQAKITFDYIFLDSWDGRERGYAGVQASLTGNPAILWAEDYDADDSTNGRIDYSFGGSSSRNDMVRTGTIHVQNNVMANGNFYLIFGSTLGSDTDDEAFGIDNIEVWVR